MYGINTGECRGFSHCFEQAWATYRISIPAELLAMIFYLTAAKAYQFWLYTKLCRRGIFPLIYFYLLTYHGKLTEYDKSQKKLNTSTLSIRVISHSDNYEI